MEDNKTPTIPDTIIINEDGAVTNYITYHINVQSGSDPAEIARKTKELIEDLAKQPKTSPT